MPYGDCQVGNGVVERQGHVTIETERLAKAVADLEERIVMLATRLENILMPPVPSPQDANKVPQKFLVHHANTLARIADSVELSRSRVMEIITRIEL